MSRGPRILVAIDRKIVEELAPGAIAEAERAAAGWAERDREMWIAGRLGVAVDAALDRKPESIRQEPAA